MQYQIEDMGLSPRLRGNRNPVARSERLLWSIPAPAGEQSSRFQEIAILWGEHKATGLFEAFGPAPVMTMQAAKPLEKNIDRAQISNEIICIDIQALLKRLSSDHNAGRCSGLLANGLPKGLVEHNAIVLGKAAMVKGDDAIASKKRLMLCTYQPFEFLLSGLRGSYSVANDENRSPLADGLSYVACNRGGVAHAPQ